MKLLRAYALGLCMLIVPGCAAVTSTSVPREGDEGLVYFMPKKDILITVTNSNGAIASVTAAASASYADRSVPYLLEYHAHWLAKNSMDLEVSEAGLLTSAKANQTGDAVVALANLGTLAGYLRGNNLALQADTQVARNVKLPSRTDCAMAGTYTFLLPAREGRHVVCGDIAISVERYGWRADGLFGKETVRSAMSSHAGVFYRTNLAYRVMIEAEGIRAEAIVHSPSESPSYLLPISRTLFANNDATITLLQGAGVPSKYFQSTDGELAALLRLPASIATSYFGAIGQVFTWRGAESTQRSNDMSSQIALEMARMKFERCMNAIEARDTDLVNSLGCKGN